MRDRWKLLGWSSVAFSSLAVAQSTPPPPVPPAPTPVAPAPSPIAAAPSAGPPPAPHILPRYPPALPALAIWRAGAVHCGGNPVAAVRAPNPLPAFSWTTQSNSKPVRFTFRVDAGGRPLGIKAAPDALLYEAPDLAPALAASRFAPAARQDCTVQFDVTRQPIAEAPVELAMAYTVFPTNSVRLPAIWDRVRPEGATCTKTRLQVLNRAFPDFRSLPGEQGRPLWSMVAFDIDRSGKPVNVRTAAGSRSTPLDAASRRAVSQSRFGREARTGCLYPYWKVADPMPAPEMPARDMFPTNSPVCEAVAPGVRPPRLAYPDNYRRRGIEGWAVISYDVAPWGAIGNAKVLAAEPSEDFGRAGISTVQSMQKAASTVGASGCIDRVRFVMHQPGEPVPIEPDAPIY
ncbi:TonB family protein [Sphingomonas aracearum]|uniref:TonB family protein n=1 Tax=Sphingomonas aracearum TaxID=2283317 RepID=A0A369VSJ0_9SPHN|nr:TonB family protein [Sphingomonas aracearum]RDE05366.1 TonB family protein [Sphingomonas aracearum]